MKREGFGTRLGFILVSAGCAIGIGNVWKFPYVTGANGGGVFVLFYLIFLVLMGAPILTMELAVGRSSRKSVVKAYQSLEPSGSKWHIHGWICLLGCYLLMMYYTTVSGWMINYFTKFVTGAFEAVDQNSIDAVFSDTLASPLQSCIFMGLTVIFGIAVCAMGIRKGIERITTIMMVCLLALIVILAINSICLPDAKEGLSFYLLPDFSRAVKTGIFDVVMAAMNQSFFTLSLGIAAMEIFGSYMSDDHTLTSEALRICILDTFVALMSGLIIFPACFSYDVETTAGPSLIFITLPRIFIHMNAGRVWGALFFLFMTFASLSTVIAVFENLIAACCENFGWSRSRSSIVNLIILFAGSLPCAFGYNLLSGITLIGKRNILDSEDFIVSNLLLPIGSLVFLLFCTTKWGWGFDNYLKEANKGEGLSIPSWLKYYFRFILPILIILILVQGLI